AMMYSDFVTATLIPVILHLGHFFEERSVLGAQAAIEGLRHLHARSATLITPDGERDVAPDTLNQGDMILVRPGDTIAADGEIVEGISAVDQSSITGESAPEDVGPESPVYAGTVNLSGLLRVRVTKTGATTALSRVVELLQEAEQSKTTVMKLIEQYAGYYVPIILIIAAVVLFITRDMSRAVAVLIVGCPGAFILAGPTAMVASLAAASRLGILIKNTKFLEALADVDTVVLDKTGTVTLGRLELVGVEGVGGVGEVTLLERALTCAAASRHPVSRAVVEAAAARGVVAPRALPGTNIEELPGKGMRASGNSHITMLGRRDWLLEEGAAAPENPDHPGPVVWVAERDGAGAIRPLGCLLLADVARPEAREAVEALRSLGIRRAVLLTGDRRAVAEQIGATLNADEVIAEVLPEQKLAVVRRECETGFVMMVGDGVNDALALASGDVGVALGAVASDVALQSADVALMTNDLGRLPMTVQLARRTRRTINQNILIGATISIGFVWLASIGQIGPLMGALLHVIGEIGVIGNSARLLGFGQTR
ncbi:MAG: heavy metal translocating P-type ATPase, partial [Thermoguttaceae bacterium]